MGLKAELMNPPPNNRQHRPVVLGEHGMVAAAEPQAAIAGLNVLMENGNAFDAAIAIALVEDVMLPAMTSIGGDAYALVYHAKSRSVYGLNGSGRAPQDASEEWFRQRGYSQLPVRGVASASVPGEIHTLKTLHERFGSLPRERLVQPAIDLAQGGFLVNERLNWRIANAASQLAQFQHSQDTFLPGGFVPEVGQRLVQENLSGTLKRLRDYGFDDFYRGDIAKRLVDYVRRQGGSLTPSDLRDHDTEITRPLRTSYRGFTVFENAPPSQGLIVLECLNLLEMFDVQKLGLGSAELMHLMVEMKKLAFADRLKYAGDPKMVQFDPEMLISKEYAKSRGREIDPTRATCQRPSDFDRPRGDTTYFAIVDQWGNAVSFIHSLSGVEFGSAEVVGDTGILLNQRLGRGFSLDRSSPNWIQPGKRSMHTLNTYLVFSDDALRFVGGTPGGDQQVQWNFQVLVGLLDFGLNVQEAAEYPRWASLPGTSDRDRFDDYTLRMESRFDELAIRRLQSMGHRVQMGSAYGSGGVQLIQVDRERGILLGGSDPRIGGIALGY